MCAWFWFNILHWSLLLCVPWLSRDSWRALPGYLCDINSLSATNFRSGNVVWLKCCFILISFPMGGARTRISGLIRGNQQMFVAARAAAETGAGSLFKRSCGDCLSEVVCWGSRDRWGAFTQTYLECGLLHVVLNWDFLCIRPSPPSASYKAPLSED